MKPDHFIPEPNSGCWLWLGALDKDGYGKIQDKRAHRVMYEIEVGPIPAGLTIDHKCRVRCCVNPAHMEPVSRGVNVLRGVGSSAENARKTHCKRGHEFTEANTRFYQNHRGRPARACRACGRAKAIKVYYNLTEKQLALRLSKARERRMRRKESFA